MKPLVYLAGPINGRTYDEAQGWRVYAQERLYPHLDVLSPMRRKQFLAGESRIEGSYEANAISSQRGITARDRLDVEQCDLVLANFLGAREASCGTPIEFGWADAYGKPIVMVMELSGNPFDHPMMRELAPFRVETLEAGFTLVRAILSTGV